MKNILSILNISVLSLLIIISSGCKHDHSDHDHDHSDAMQSSDHHNSENTKIVHLNTAQYQNAEIDTGWFEMKNINDVVRANGYTKLDPQNEADISMPISGTIRSIGVIEGDEVKKGQILATMTSLEYNGMLRELSQLKEERSSLESRIPYLESEFERQKLLNKENINSKKAFQKISADLKEAEGTAASLSEQIILLKEAIDMLGIKRGKRLAIVAPISGFITHLDVKIGSVIQPGIPIFHIVDNSKMHVDLMIYEKDLQKIKVGQTARFILTNQSNREIYGEIYNIGKSFANETKSVAVHADINDTDANLIPGMFINALIDIGSNKVPTLPEEAIVMTEGKWFIFVSHGTHYEDLDENKDPVKEYEFERVEIGIGSKQLGYAEVIPLSEIDSGLKIVTRGAYYLQSHLQKSEGGGGHSH